MPLSVIAFIIGVILISFAFGGLMIKWQNDLKREKFLAENSSNSLGTSELRGMMQETMLDTVAPIEERLELIEAHMRQLPESRENTASAELSDGEDPGGLT